MNKLLTVIAAAAIGIGTAGAAQAQMETHRTTVVQTHSERHHYDNGRHMKRRVCTVSYRHHQRVRHCRTVWR